MKHNYIEIRNVSKSFGKIIAVDDVSLCIEKGEFFSLLGPSGCGKTTLLRLLAGFEIPDMGDLLIDNTPMSRVAAHRRPTNMVFQNYAIFPHLDVQANVSYGLRSMKLGKSRTKLEVEKILSLVKLSGFESRAANELSGGQRQRVALARALVMQPKVLLLDEPLGALDKKLREEMQVELRALQQKVGITFVFVTHDQEEALTMSDRIAVMNKGEILQIGSPKEIYEQPRSRAVAAFIGQMNLIDGVVSERTKESVEVDIPIFEKIRLAKMDSAFQAGDKVTVAIRPENLSISIDSKKHSIQVELHHCSYYGETTNCLVTIPPSEVKITVSMQNFDGPQSIGTKFWLSWQETDFVLLET